jgi:multidrug efflux system membrane fusion protein
MMPRLTFSTICHCLVLIPLIGFTGCGKKPPQHEIPPRPVTTAKVEQKDVPLYIDSIGKCTALQVVSIQPQVTGQLMQVHFKQGQELKKDSLLFTIDPRTYQASLDKAVAQLANDKASLQNREAKLRRSKELVPGEYISPQDLETLETDVATMKAQIQGDQAAIDQARINLDYCSIKAPVDGRTGLLLVDIGNIVTPGSTTSMVSLQTLDPIYVDFVIVEKDLGVVQKYSATATLKAEISFFHDLKFRRTGDLFVIDNTVQKGTGTIKLRAIVPNQDRALWPEQFVNVRLILDTIKNAVLVPAESVKEGQMGYYVFVVKEDSTVDLRPVKPGQLQGDQMVILGGVKPGETVVVTGQLTLSPGAKVVEQSTSAPEHHVEGPTHQPEQRARTK